MATVRQFFHPAGTASPPTAPSDNTNNSDEQTNTNDVADPSTQVGSEEEDDDGDETAAATDAPTADDGEAEEAAAASQGDEPAGAAGTATGADPGTEANDNLLEEDNDAPATAAAPPAPRVTEEGADKPESVQTEADGHLDSVYGDHPHQNDGRHLDGGVADDPFWQGHWKRTVQLPLTSYSVPSGKVGRRFVATLAQEFAGVRQRKWNSERPLVFAAVILQTTQGTTRATDIRKRITQRMDLWDGGKYDALVDDTEDELLSCVGLGRRTTDEDAEMRRFNSTVLSSHLRKAVRGLTNRDGGGVLQPDEPCTKTGRPVLEVLRGKHPAMRDPVLVGPEPGAFT